jgi:hypothetical protein
MVVKTEGQHQGEYLVSEGNGAISREAGTIASGQVIKDGDVLSGTPGALVKLSKTTGIVASDVVGIAYGDWDATNGAIEGVPYIARFAEVKEDLIRGPDGADEAQLVAALAARFIIPRAS